MHNVNHAHRDERHQRQVETAITIIRNYHLIGSALVNQHQLDKKMNQLYEPLNPDTQAKIRRFASPGNGGYTSKQMEDLLKHCEKKNYPLGFKLIERLMSIEDKGLRLTLQKQMVDEKWSRRELDCQIALIRTNSNWKGGRQVERLPTAEGVLPELWHMSKEWAERASRIASNYPDSLKELNEADRNRFTMATAMLQKLKRSLDVHLRKVQPRISKEKAPVPTPKGRH